MKIPFFDIKRQYAEIGKELEDAVISVMRSGKYIGGDVVQRLEESLSQYIGTKHAISCGNGTDALFISLKALGVGPGDEVITSPFSFFATAEAISRCGAKPVFADIREDTLNISPDSILDVITDRTKAILPVHIFGLPADMDEINKIALGYGVAVIEDACQAIGAEYKGRKTGALGDMGCFSFYPTKNLGAFGDGGLITTNDDRLATCCRAIKTHASGKIGADAYKYLYHEDVVSIQNLISSDDMLYDPYKYYNYFIGENSRLDAIQAAVLMIKLPNLDTYNKKRRGIALKYNKAFSDLPILTPITNEVDKKPCFHQYAILTDKKDELALYLAERGVGTGAFYPVPLHLQKAYKNLDYAEGSIPVAERACRRSLCLPVFPELTDVETDYIIEQIRSFYNG